MEIQAQLRNVRKREEPKEMLSIKKAEGRQIVRINFSSLNVVQACMKRAYFNLERGLQSKLESSALTFGKAFHEAMEIWYSSPHEIRKPESGACDDAQALKLSGQNPAPHEKCARCAAVFAFLEGTPTLGEADGARDPSIGILILNSYFDHYLSDPFEVFVDASGPFVERDFEYPLGEFAIEGEGVVDIRFFGRIDSVLRNRETSEIVVTDHKTTSALGKDFLNRIKPNFQYTGYWMAAKDIFGINPSRFLVNGVQVAKHKRDFARQFTTVTDEEIQNLKDAILWNVTNYMKARRSGMWPMSAPDACTQWGGCSYKRICELPKSLHESMISVEFENRGEVREEEIKEPQPA